MLSKEKRRELVFQKTGLAYHPFLASVYSALPTFYLCQAEFCERKSRNFGRKKTELKDKARQI